MPNQVRFRRDTSHNWSITEYKLGPGEPGFAWDTKVLKIGDGEHYWDDLESFVAFNEGAGYVTDQELQDHIDSGTPHPVYDDGPSLYLLYENAKV